MSEDSVRSTPEDAFSLIGNEVRAAIVETLAAPEDEGPWKELSFSTLRERVDPEMDTGQFNYHLQQLVGTFVQRTEDGYQITATGVHLYRTIASGRYTRSETIEPFDAGFDCHFCGARVEGFYEDDQFHIECPDCAHTYVHTIVPPSVIDDEDELLRRIDRITREEARLAADRVCPRCLHRLDVGFIRAEDSYFHEGEHLDVQVRATCPHCGASRTMSVGTALLDEAALVSFAHEHGLDVTDVPIWELAFASTDRTVSVRSRDPWEVALSLSLDGETLELVVDDTLSVLETTVR